MYKSKYYRFGGHHACILIIRLLHKLDYFSALIYTSASLVLILNELDQ